MTSGHTCPMDRRRERVVAVASGGFGQSDAGTGAAGEHPEVMAEDGPGDDQLAMFKASAVQWSSEDSRLKMAMQASVWERRLCQPAKSGLLIRALSCWGFLGAMPF